MDVLLYILGIFAMLLGIAVSIGIHEIGHLVPAKIFGVRVKQYMIGFGPTVFSRVRGETEYGIKAIPLGGYILMTGMFPPEKKPYRGPFSNWINDARREVLKDEIQGEEERQFYQQSTWKKLTIMLGGPLMNLVLGVALIVSSLSLIGPLQPNLSVNEVFDCLEGDSCSVASPAKTAGLLPGDKIVSVNSQAVAAWPEAIEILAKDTSGSNLGIMRDGVLIQVPITPVFVERQLFDDSGAALKDANGLPLTELRPMIGIRLGSQNVPLGFGESFGYASDVIVGTAGFIIDLPNQIFTVLKSTLGFEERDQNGVVSIVGVGQLAGELTSSDGLGLESKIASLLLLIGSLNIALFAFNLIPLLPLDGGHVASALYEGVKRRGSKLLTGKDPGPIDTARGLPLAYLVWVLLIAVGLVLIMADLVNPIQL
jgi:membrane-associated protease RseP (regulator of RpoE activity)